ncbi:hypothetical protein EXN66_Car009228 [Channa argus]|uniref:Uncharacterized protein n=1 Tax=Channa argus TaxID=215402 RepID=A0A6G1PTG0_CHAAH|nr:hypothetical protein EXN66_Car009228 [Channa argus]
MALYTKKTSHKIIPQKSFAVPPIPANGKQELFSLPGKEQVYCYWCVIRTRWQRVCSRLQRASLKIKQISPQIKIRKKKKKKKAK